MLPLLPGHPESAEAGGNLMALQKASGAMIGCMPIKTRCRPLQNTDRTYFVPMDQWPRVEELLKTVSAPPDSMTVKTIPVVDLTTRKKKKQKLEEKKRGQPQKEEHLKLEPEELPEGTMSALCGVKREVEDEPDGTAALHEALTAADAEANQTARRRRLQGGIL